MLLDFTSEYYVLNKEQTELEHNTVKQNVMELGPTEDKIP